MRLLHPYCPVHTLYYTTVLGYGREGTNRFFLLTKHCQSQLQARPATAYKKQPNPAFD